MASDTLPISQLPPRTVAIDRLGRQVSIHITFDTIEEAHGAHRRLLNDASVGGTVMIDIPVVPRPTISVSGTVCEDCRTAPRLRGYRVCQDCWGDRPAADVMVREADATAYDHAG